MRLMRLAERPHDLKLTVPREAKQLIERFGRLVKAVAVVAAALASESFAVFDEHAAEPMGKGKKEGSGETSVTQRGRHVKNEKR